MLGKWVHCHKWQANFTCSTQMASAKINSVTGLSSGLSKELLLLLEEQQFQKRCSHLTSRGSLIPVSQLSARLRPEAGRPEGQTPPGCETKIIAGPGESLSGNHIESDALWVLLSTEGHTSHAYPLQFPQPRKKNS